MNAQQFASSQNMLTYSVNWRRKMTSIILKLVAVNKGSIASWSFHIDAVEVSNLDGCGPR